MTLTPSADTANASPATDSQALAWALISQRVRLVERGVFEVEGETVGPNGHVVPVKFRVRVEL